MKHLPIAALLFAPAAAWSAELPTASEWTDWEPAELVRKDTNKPSPVRAWESMKVTDYRARTTVSALVISTFAGVACAAAERTYEHAYGEDGSPVVKVSYAAIEHVKAFDGLNQAYAKCRQEVARKIGLPAGSDR